MTPTPTTAVASWQTAARCAAYASLVLLGANWVASAVGCLEAPALGSDAAPGYDALIMLARGSGYDLQAALRVTAMVLSVKLIVGAYLLATVAFAAAHRVAGSRVDPLRLDRALLLALAATMLTVSPLLPAGQVLPTTIDDLTVVVFGIVLAALGQPAFLGEVETMESVGGDRMPPVIEAGA